MCWTCLAAGCRMLEAAVAKSFLVMRWLQMSSQAHRHVHWNCVIYVTWSNAPLLQLRPGQPEFCRVCQTVGVLQMWCMSMHHRSCCACCTCCLQAADADQLRSQSGAGAVGPLRRRLGRRRACNAPPRLGRHGAPSVASFLESPASMSCAVVITCVAVMPADWCIAVQHGACCGMVT